MKVIVAAVLAMSSVVALAKEVSDVRVNGLMQMTPVRAFEIIGFERGQGYDSNRVYDAVKQLFASGYFSDIDVYEDNNELIFDVVERPIIGELNIEGNDLIATDDLERGLDVAGLQSGEVFKPDTLNQIEQELQRQYYALGRYSAKVDIDVEEMPRNRVAIKINIEEGVTAKIVHINIVGNKAFDDETLKKQFQSAETGFFNPFSSADEYAKPKIQGDLEALKSYYLDNGYLDYQLVSSQVSVSPDKRKVYVVVNLDEGEPYYVNDISLGGSLPISEDRVWQHIDQAKGDVFSRQQITRIMDAISTELGDEGYLFTKVNILPNKRDDHTVDLTYHITPGPQVYVRRINFSGNTETRDEVLRREMTQFEGALATHSKIQASKRAIERLGFFGNVDLRTRPVPGTTDQVDLDVTVEEQPSGSIQASIGYSQADGTVIGFGISKRNFLGTGNKLALNISRTNQTQDYTLSYYNPYFTVDGISRGYDLFYKVSDHNQDDVEDYDLDELGAGVNFGYPLDETQRLSFGVTVKETIIKLGSSPSNETSDYVTKYGEQFDDVIANVSWSDSDLIGGVLPTEGYSHKVTVDVATPLGDQSYFKLGVNSQAYWNLNDSNLWLFRLKGRLGYGRGFGDTDILPFFENYYAGGAYSIRGFSSSSLGPRNSYSDTTTSTSAIGGNILLTSTAELIFPMPMVEDHKSVRTALFLDAGNVFTEYCHNSNTTCVEGIDMNEIRYSMGLNWTWITPIAPLSFNLAKVLNPKDGDSTDFFQFQLGTTF
ncbi:outer membrane protein assembly factor BamA [Maribrevibacterium harenarium]|uniref:Outer membrane protein assembly factor BamA n=1 Tax=Maribrevibacterium harenarium TaxID=2589817 RepID=A0A501WSY4_9GAMM|nr:outer membrane protein assembly factor BamA [Maribrevibacterium harenarium]TPE52823.1 outer membrane protein assembly factor BamA [Maribrevibacterium harenarium]